MLILYNLGNKGIGLYKGGFTIFSQNIVIIGIIAVILTSITSYTVGKINPKLGEILNMQMVFPLGVFLFTIIIALLYYGAVWITNALINKKEEEKNENKIENLEKFLCNNKDLYLEKIKCSCDLAEYQIKNHEKKIIGYSKCISNQSIIQSIWLYSSDNHIEPIMVVTRSPDGVNFLINDKKATIGYLSERSNGLVYYNLDMQMRGTIYDNEIHDTTDDADVLYMIATFTPASSKKSKQFILKGENAILGKYYASLRNIDLTQDINDEFDIRVASIAAIFLDVKFS
jgi:hypothetical protein